MQYFRDKKVTVTASSGDAVEAAVSGSEPYRVRLTRDSKRLLATCSCPFFTDREEICKHVWATVLAADLYRGLRGPGGTLPLRLVAEGKPAPPKSPAPVRAPSPPKPPPPPLPRTIKAPPPPTWLELLSQIPLEEAVPQASRSTLVYVVDVPATLAKQQLALDLMSGRKRSDGTLGKLYPLRIHRSDVLRLPDPADREILSLIAGAEETNPYMRWYNPNALPSRSQVPLPAAGVLLPLLCATGRCRARPVAGAEDTEPLAWDDGPPWQLWLEVREDEDGGCSVTASVRRGEQSLPISEPALLLQSGLVLTGNHVARLETNGAFGWIPLLRQTGGSLRVPAADREKLVEQLLSLPVLPRLDLPEDFRVEEVRSTPRYHLHLLLPPNAGEKKLPADLSFFYEGREVPDGTRGRGLFLKEERRFLVRDREAEQQAAERLSDLGFRRMEVLESRAPAVIRTLLAEGWTVDAEGRLYRSAGAFQLSVASGIDWFEMRGQAEFEGESVGLPELLAALRKGESFVTLDDGSLGLIPEEWLKRLGPVAALGQAEGDHLKFKAAQVALLDAWLESEPAATCDEAFDRARQRLRSFEGVTPAAAPRGFRGDLRGYQRAGLGWLHFLRDFGFGGCLADDMGLGKTIQVLALLESRRTLASPPPWSSCRSR